MDSLFTVVDSAGKARYEGSSLREGYDIWKIVVHATYIHTDKDCGGGTTLDFADEGGYERLMDSSCGRMSCDDCNPMDADMPPLPEYNHPEDLCEGCDVMFKHHMPSDEHAFSGTMNYNFGK
tara:strand:+ start:114 stop:479 length:366 start_codon:yes stop_codon:yes gene_type:complete